MLFADPSPSLPGRDRMFLPAVAVIALLLLALQWAGGAWTAEFDGYPDESGQFVSGRMIWEYVSTFPGHIQVTPLHWAGQYYLHYPKVAIGHWPPGYHLAEALWSVPFGSSRISAMWLQWLLTLTALGGLYRLARPALSLPVTCAILLLAIAAPVSQQGLEQTMAEPFCLFFAVMLLHALLRWLRNPDRVAGIFLAAIITGAILVKGTGLCFVPVPFIALFAAGKRPSPRWWWLAVLVPLGIGLWLLWPLAGNAVIYWGGITLSMPWPLQSFGALAGWGCVALATLGLRRTPLAIAAASTIAGALGISFLLRAMNEPRHWIIVLPAILLLAGHAVQDLSSRARFGSLASVGAILVVILTFPWAWYHQTPAGYKQFLSRVRLPARMLVSSGLVSSGQGSSGDGGLIATITTGERYPATLVVRASKVLAHEGWNGENYTLLVRDHAAVDRLLDELALDLVVLDKPDATAPPHHVLLAATMRTNPSWRVCQQSGRLTAWCRVLEPKFPRQPLRLEAGGREIVEDLTAQKSP